MITEERLDEILLTSELWESEAYEEVFDAVCKRIKHLFETGMYREHAMAIMNLSSLVQRYGWPITYTKVRERRNA